MDDAGIVTSVAYGSATITATIGSASADVPVAVKLIAALSFDAAQHQFAETPDHPLLDLADEWTIEAWISPGAPTGLDQHVVSTWGGGGNASYMLGMGASGKVRTGIHDGVDVSQAVESVTSLAADTWQHVAITLGGGTLRLYINGVVDVTFPASVTPMNSDRPRSFGHEGPPYNGWWYNGLLAEVRIWSVARTGDEIAVAMDSRLTGTELGLVAYWPFSEGSGDVLNDATANGLDVRLGSTVGVDANDPTWVPGGGAPVR